MVRVTEQRIKRVLATARRNFFVELPVDVARAMLIWDDDFYFVQDLQDDGVLDTASLDYFGMAMLEQLLPEKPTVQDGLISLPQEKWHFPLNGSSSDYIIAFAKAYAEAIRPLIIKEDVLTWLMQS